MAHDILVTTDRITRDPTGREFIAHLQAIETQYGLGEAALYYDFPTYSDYETVAHKPDALLVSGKHGIFAIRFIGGAGQPPMNSAELDRADESLGQFSSILIGRLLKSRSLRRGLSQLAFPVTPVILAITEASNEQKVQLENSELVSSLQGFNALLESVAIERLSSDALAETRSVVEGAKALTRPQKRVIENTDTQKPANALAKLEAEIANFDQRQRRAALVTIDGPQRIRGLAGSGKTVILAMKAAHLHLTRPEERILVTFYTRSLRGAIKSLITRFYRHYRDEDPDWSRIQIRHAWGGANTTGVYADACRRAGVVPISFGAARQAAAADPFDFVCRDLLKRATLEQYYDHILIDEGQDFPDGFYQLCFYITKGDRDRKSIVWAYDELQNILNVKIRSPEDLFGIDTDGQPRVSLERSGRSLPPGGSNDTVLSKCYRNQREVLVTAHALGFGIYGDHIVQMLESRDHWQDVGYEVASDGEFKVGDKISVLRPPGNSPVSIAREGSPTVIESFVGNLLSDEVSWAVNGVKSFLDGGLQPEDILLIALDDRNSRTYLRQVSSALASHGIASNNITADPYDEPPFFIPGKVTLSTVYRAKGNEASVVFALGTDAIDLRTRSGRNKLFTAFTRTKAWLRVSGIGPAAQKVRSEIDIAKQKFPYIEFTMPDLNKVNMIQRDLGKRSIKAKKIRDEYAQRLKDEGFTEEEIAEILTVEVKNG